MRTRLISRSLVRRVIGATLATGILALSPGLAFAQSGTWLLTGGTASGTWGDSANWVSGTIASGRGSTATFGSQGNITADTTISIAAPVEIGNLMFTRSATSSSVFTLRSTVAGLNPPLTLSVDSGAPTITTTNVSVGITSSVSGTQGLIKAGNGTLQLGTAAANDYTGVTSVNAGTLQISNSSSLGASGSGNGTTITSGARVQFANGITVAEDFSIAGTGVSGALNNGSGDNTITGLVTLTAAASVGGGAGGKLTFQRSGGDTAIDNGGNLATFSGSGNFDVKSPIVGSGGLTKSGSGTLTLTGANTYSGATTITGGALNVRNSSALGGTGSGVSITGGALQLQGGISIGNEALSITGVGTGNSGSLRNISGDNSYGGAVTLTGTTQINSDADTLTLSGGISGASPLIIGGAANTSVSGNITTGTGTLTKTGAGTLTMTGANTYTGNTTVSAGVLQLGNGGTGGSLATTGAISLGGVSGSQFQVNQSDTVIQGVDFSSAAITGQGGFTQVGSGTTILNAVNTYKGPTNVNAGTLLINGDQGGGNATGAVTVANGATLGGSGSIGGAVTVNGILSPGNSPGILTVASLDLETGSTTLMQIIGDGNLAGDAGTHYDKLVISTAGGLRYGGTLDLDFANTATFADGTTFELLSFTGLTSRHFSSVISTGSGSYGGLNFSGVDGVWTALIGRQQLTFSELTGQLRFTTNSAVPEIDPATGSSALSLLAGVFALIEQRRRRAKPMA